MYYKMQIECSDCKGFGFIEHKEGHCTCSKCSGNGFTFVEYEKFSGIKIREDIKDVDGIPYLKWCATHFIKGECV